MLEKEERRIEELIVETRRQKDEISRLREKSKEKLFKLSVPTNPMEEKLRAENENLQQMLQEEINNVHNLEDKVEILTDEKDYLEQTLDKLRKQSIKLSQYDNNSRKSKSPSFLKGESSNEYPEQRVTVDDG